jgi:hypothetical protein
MMAGRTEPNQQIPSRAVGRYDQNRPARYCVGSNSGVLPATVAAIERPVIAFVVSPRC